MCGIVGYVGKRNAKDIIIDGLKRLEYRGYDSAGIALLTDKGILVRKRVGGIANLENLISDENLSANVGIGHTRWATHGAPSDVNSHPHTAFNDRISIVHNGIIENYAELKHMLVKEHKIEFKSETDTEVAAHLIGLHYEETGSLEDAIFETAKEIKGAYSIVAVAADEPGKLVAIRNDAPIIVGKGNGENFVASDIPALLGYAEEIYPMGNSEVVVLTEDSITFYNSKRKVITHNPLDVNWDIDAAEKEGFEHFLLKEIFDQPNAIRETIKRRLDSKGNINLEGATFTKEILDDINKIYIVACGTSYYAGLVGKALIEKYVKIPVETDVASEFRYRDAIVDKHTLFIAISQSGETSDTLQALREAKAHGARILSIVNVVGSSVARESDDCLYTWAGPEISVASTKAYTTQLIMLYLLSLYMGITKKTVTKKFAKEFVDELLAIPDKMLDYLNNAKEVEKLAVKFSDKKQIFYIGRGLDAHVAFEGSLKLKEISYINSFAIQAGELKHGTIALMEEGVVTIALSTQDALISKMASNMQEVKARGAYVLAIAKEGNDKVKDHSSYTLFIPRVRDEIAPLLSVVPLQLFAYYFAKANDRPIHKPRNLAKSVTVE
ncbi:MAG: glutamine--fructose-6-phosphate transaminase (isomerizing) [Clostridia bacterium]|nr:glutamine--fructose-6-phosphate transaminase (isomerizing) [Clostridia bacterium]